jgi:hypothetical protein
MAKKIYISIIVADLNCQSEGFEYEKGLVIDEPQNAVLDMPVMQQWLAEQIVAAKHVCLEVDHE